MPRPWDETIEAHRRGVRDAILDTTAALVMEQGLRSVTMSQIAEQAAIGRATLYRYFPDVEAILVAWHDKQVAEHLAVLADTRDRAEAGERIATVLETYALLSHHSHGHVDAEVAAALHRSHQAAESERRVLRLLGDLFADAARTGEVRTDVSPAELATFCIHALSAASSLRSKSAIRRLVALTCAGLAPPA